MPCYAPLRVATDQDGQLDWTVYNPNPDLDQVVLVPCRKCLGCKASEARDWTIRVYHEASLHWKDWKDPLTGLVTRIPENSFLTLTYDDAHLPADGLLRLSDVQQFLRTLRRKRKKRFPYFLAGEYGALGRPHYHLIALGLDPEERYEVTTSDQQTLSCSLELDEAWQHRGRVTVDDVNARTIRYTTGYVVKKAHANGNFTGPLAEGYVEETGQMVVRPLQPEFRTMSRRPGLAREWIEQNFERVYPADQVVIDGQELPPPAYYDRWLRQHHPELHTEVVRNRFDKRIQAQREWTPERVASAEIINSQKLRSQSL